MPESSPLAKLQIWQNDIWRGTRRPTNLAKRHLTNTFPHPKISRSAPPDFHKLMFGGGMAEKCRECQIMILAFPYLAGGMFGNALQNLKIVICNADCN